MTIGGQYTREGGCVGLNAQYITREHQKGEIRCMKLNHRQIDAREFFFFLAEKTFKLVMAL